MTDGWIAIRSKSYRFWLLAAFLTFAFLTGGSSRSDVQSLFLLRPVSVIVCGIGLLTLRIEHIRNHKWLFAIAWAVVLVVAAQLIPLPIGVSALRERSIIPELVGGTSEAHGFMPISLAPSMTLNAFFALIPPLAILVIGIQLNREDRLALFPVVLLLALSSGLVGLLQAVGSPGGPLYFYRITNSTASVGFFANRNHQATLLALLFPILAVYASGRNGIPNRRNIRSAIALAAAVILVPLILVTGSRTGLLIGLLGAFSSLLLYRKSLADAMDRRIDVGMKPLLLLGCFAAVVLSAVSVMVSRAEAVNRLFTQDGANDLRWQIWQPIADVSLNYLPMGSGSGSFPVVYRYHEADWQLGPAVVNQAHNDWLDLLLTTGLSGIVLVTAAGVGLVRLAYAAFRIPIETGRQVQISRLGAVCIFLVVLTASVDYALRTPIMAMIFMILVIWLVSVRDGRSTRITN